MGCGASSEEAVRDPKGGGGGTGGSGGGAVQPPPRVLRFYTASEVARHASMESLWTIIRWNVYDVTDFVESHPGGEDVLIQFAGGKDATALFTQPGDDRQPFAHAHSRSANTLLESMQIGKVVGATDPRAGRTLQEVEAEEVARNQEEEDGVSPANEDDNNNHNNPAVPTNPYHGSPLRAQALHRIKQVERKSNHLSPMGSKDSSPLTGLNSMSGRGGGPLSANGLSVLQAFDPAEVARHALPDDCWTIAWRGQVYDVTSLVASTPTQPTPIIDHRKVAGKDCSAYLASTFPTPQGQDRIYSLFTPLQVGFLEGHSVQNTDLGRVASGLRGSSLAATVAAPAGGMHGSPAGPGGRRVSTSRSVARPSQIDSAQARAALDAIAGDDLTVAAAEGLLASPSNVRFLWTLVGRRELTHDTVLLTFDPLVSSAGIAAFRAELSEDDHELAAKYPVSYSHTPLRTPIAHHVSIEIPNQLPVENSSEHLQRERENRPLDVPFRMQRSYTPLDAGHLLLSSRNNAHMQLAVKSYPKVVAPGSSYLHSLGVGDIIVTTGARSRFDFEAALVGTGPHGEKQPYEFWICIVAGSGIAAVYAIIRDMLRRMAQANATAAAAAATQASQGAAATQATTASPNQPYDRVASPDSAAHAHGRGRSSSRAGGASVRRDSLPSSTNSASAAAAAAAAAAAGSIPPCKRIILIYCNRSEEDIILGSELDALVESHPHLFSIFHVLSTPLFSPKHSSFTGRLNHDILRFVLPTALQPSGANASVSLGPGISEVSQLQQQIGNLLSAGAGGGPPGSRPRSPSSAPPRPDPKEIHARVLAASSATVLANGGAAGGGGGGSLGGSVHASPLLQAQPHPSSLPSSRPGSRPRSPSRFHFNMPSRTPQAAPRSPLLAPAISLSAAPHHLQHASSGGGGGGGSGSGSTPDPASPNPVPQDLLHVPDRLLHARPGAGGEGEALTHQQGVASAGTTTTAGSSHRSAGSLPSSALPVTRIGLGLRNSTSVPNDGGAGSARVKATGLALVCGPLEFNQSVLAMLVKFGFKRGMGNYNGKDVHVF